ncbi:FISUMP domain-containing protein [Bacteroidota bacterium]
MKTIITFLILCFTAFAQQTVTDYDGNIYETITIGDQVWIKENLKSLHYCDGEPVPGVVAYNNDDSLGAIYGLLYTWNAAMNGSTEPGIQGVCPCDWHVPTDEEWTILENFLGGPSVAGGKMKETGTEHWLSPNTGATNSSGFTGLPAGEYDAYFNPNKFWLLHTAAVFWTSSQTNQSQAIERYLSYDDAVCGSLAWQKVMKYSIRCIKDSPSKIEIESYPIHNYELLQNYPNPFNPITTLKYEIPVPGFVSLKVFDLLGNEVATLVNENSNAGSLSVKFDATGLTSGIYYYQLLSDNFIETKKMILLK